MKISVTETLCAKTRTRLQNSIYQNLTLSQISQNLNSTFSPFIFTKPRVAHPRFRIPRNRNLIPAHLYNLALRLLWHLPHLLRAHLKDRIGTSQLLYGNAAKSQDPKKRSRSRLPLPQNLMHLLLSRVTVAPVRPGRNLQPSQRSFALGRYKLKQWPLFQNQYLKDLRLANHRLTRTKLGCKMWMRPMKTILHNLIWISILSQLRTTLTHHYKLKLLIRVNLSRNYNSQVFYIIRCDHTLCPCLLNNAVHSRRNLIFNILVYQFLPSRCSFC